VIHQTDCCGNSAAWGINDAEVEDFEAAEAICSGMYPECDCPAMPPLADDGNNGTLDELGVDCVEGACMTFVEG
jgi:hypothetical protein